MNNRIDLQFRKRAEEGRKVLIPFITAGDPDPAWTVAMMHALVDAGADLLELGVPFSDPMADGPVIQAASERAISRGVTLHQVLASVAEFRRQDQQTPVVLMGYLNPIERFGHADFAREAAGSGVDGLLLVDCPPEEMADLRAELVRHDVYPIYLVAPTTTPERMDTIALGAYGYLYYVSFKGITGANRLDQSSLADPIREIRSHSGLPLAVGFGIKDAASAAAVADLADAVVIGSALIEQAGRSTTEQEVCERVSAFLAPIRQAMDNKRP